MARFLSRADMAAVRHAQDVRNAQIKRGEIDVADDIREVVSVCSCGADGCVAVSGIKGRIPLYPGHEHKVGYF